MLSARLLQGGAQSGEVDIDPGFQVTRDRHAALGAPFSDEGIDIQDPGSELRRGVRSTRPTSLANVSRQARPAPGP